MNNSSFSQQIPKFSIIIIFCLFYTISAWAKPSNPSDYKIGFGISLGGGAHLSTSIGYEPTIVPSYDFVSLTLDIYLNNQFSLDLRTNLAFWPFVDIGAGIYTTYRFAFGRGRFFIGPGFQVNFISSALLLRFPVKLGYEHWLRNKFSIQWQIRPFFQFIPSSSNSLLIFGTGIHFEMVLTFSFIRRVGQNVVP